MFIWRIVVIQAAFQKLMPETFGALHAIGQALGTPSEQSVLEREYPTIPVQAIDIGIMERADRIATIPSDFGWSDVGSWTEIHAIAPKDADGNAVRGEHVGVDTRRTLVFAEDRPVFTLGVEDLVVVSLPDAVLVCRRDRAEHVRQIVERLQGDPRWADLL
jgi:mannose-1-phosphate guanylyltransferase